MSWRKKLRHAVHSVHKAVTKPLAHTPLGKVHEKAEAKVHQVATRTGHFVGRQFTKTGFRHQMKVAGQVGKVAVPVATAAVTYLAGPIVGEAFGYAGSQLVGYSVKTGDRGKYKGHEASMRARKVQKRVFKYAQIGVGVGGIATSAVALAGGSGSAGALVGQTANLGIKLAGPAIASRQHRVAHVAGRPIAVSAPRGVTLESSEGATNAGLLMGGDEPMLVDESQGPAPSGGGLGLGAIVLLGLGLLAMKKVS